MSIFHEIQCTICSFRWEREDPAGQSVLFGCPQCQGNAEAENRQNFVNQFTGQPAEEAVAELAGMVYDLKRLLTGSHPLKNNNGNGHHH